MTWLYMVQTKDAGIYTGVCEDYVKRMAQHESGRGARYIKVYGFGKLIFLSWCKTKGEAMRSERLVKKLSPTKKLKLVCSEKNVFNQMELK